VNLCDIVRVVISPLANTIFTIILTLNGQIAMAAQISIFASSLTATVPLLVLDTCDVYQYDSIFNDCKLRYIIWLAVFVAICMTLTIIGISE
jgi:hypothetical protein